MTDALVLRDVCKAYGDREAVKGISFSVGEGEIFGLIGPNGAGKTTTLRMICTLLGITSGTISVCGHDVSSEGDAVRRIISYLPEDSGAYKDLTGRQYIRFMAGFFASGAEFDGMVARGIETAGLGPRIDSKVSTYSKGMTRRLLIARAMMPSPRLAVMDEITSGLDVLNAYDIRESVKRIAENGTTVLISSHNMFEVESLCHRVAMINKGRIVELGTPRELMDKYGAKNLEEVFVRAVRG
ncbi:MAG: ABC transporter ATP-binding protein [Candidatus Methanomethylophilus sp.]|jgi:ABC-2 type transport system ATP-binding protein|nr:ABC transporter ATP-binding protein [Methanomethylophilus sp.]MCI2075253.1 ABC transporter ATP-binding protein [Methanomethylophilus sp.]MCI2092595.1 ABC transporter ATP-binding protein [Methanomethylophilus sp.]MEE3400901.1 ABC transporter ATP-binding protein [Methanomethylophilus sp.]WII09937.1 ABC transporter ATP-binding protein [Methanomassiliicoccales archaeon LGM-DZ1]